MRHKALFPAQAGVIPGFVALINHEIAVPRASGGDPAITHTARYHANCSPRKRG